MIEAATGVRHDVEALSNALWEQREALQVLLRQLDAAVASVPSPSHREWGGPARVAYDIAGSLLRRREAAAREELLAAVRMTATAIEAVTVGR